MLGGIEFWCREELFHFFGLLLSSSSTHKPLRGRDRRAVLALLNFHKVLLQPDMYVKQSVVAFISVTL